MSYDLSDAEQEAVRRAYAELLNALADHDALPPAAEHHCLKAQHALQELSFIEDEVPQVRNATASGA